MNTPEHPAHEPHSLHVRERIEREWLAQEHAREAERSGLPPARGDGRGAEYRLIARALRTPAMEPLPPDLAAQIVRRVAAAQASGERVEHWLQRSLLAVLALSAAAAVALYGASWAPAFVELWSRLPAGTGGWAGLLVVCLGVSLAGQWVERHLPISALRPA